MAECPFSGVVVSQPTIYQDDRGWLTEIFRRDDWDSSLIPEMAYVSVTLGGHSRGPHEHVFQTDQFTFLGPGNLELHLWDDRSNSATYGEHWIASYGETRPAQVVIPPGVVHGYRNTGNTPAWVLNMPDQLYAGDGKSQPVDEIRHEDDPDSPFQFDW